MNWTEENIPDQSAKVAIVTGANSGIGFETARMLAHRGASVTLACRSEAKGEAAVQKILAEQPSGQVALALIDLSDLNSVAKFAEAFVAANERLDLLINNAGVMVPPETRTRQGFELQFGVNHLGHFALAGQLMPLLLDSPKSRVVCVSSVAHRSGRMDFDDLNFNNRAYLPWVAYGQSKLANLLFALGLQNRLSSAKADVKVASAHPGYTSTELQRTSIFRLLNPLVAMHPKQGALPTLRAATDPEVIGGEYFGPQLLMEMRGYPDRAFRTEAARSSQDAERLWEISESLTGVKFDFAA